MPWNVERAAQWIPGALLSRHFTKDRIWLRQSNFSSQLHNANRLSVTTTAVTPWSEMFTHSWHTTVVNHLYPPEAPMTFLRKYLVFATWLTNQDAECISDRIRHLEEKEKAAKTPQRQAVEEHKRGEKIRKARQQLRDPACCTGYLIAALAGAAEGV